VHSPFRALRWLLLPSYPHGTEQSLEKTKERVSENGSEKGNKQTTIKKKQGKKILISLNNYHL